MASNFIQYTKHPVVEVSNLLGTMGGEHIFNMLATEDIDNGALVALGDFVPDGSGLGGVFKAKTPAVGDDVWLIASVPDIASVQGMPMSTEEFNFYNAKGEMMRAYHLGKYDTFSLDDIGFSKDSKPAVGKYVVVDGKGTRPVVVDKLAVDAPNAFVGFIYEVATNGRYRVLVKKNS